MPQPKNTPADAEDTPTPTPAEGTVATAEEEAILPPPDDLPAEHNPAVNELLQGAQALADEKSDLLKRIGANRDILRNYQTLKIPSAEQWTAINEFYRPQKRTPKNAANGTAA
jgi:hypothetical protein